MALSEIVGKMAGKDSPEPAEDFPGMDSENTGESTDPRPLRPEGKTGKKTPAPRVTPQLRKEITDKVGAMVEFFAMGWELRDEYCGAAMADQADEITSRVVAIVIKRPAALRWFTEGADYQDWLMLATALQPVTKAMWAHHVTKTVELDDQGQDVNEDAYAAPPLAA